MPTHTDNSPRSEGHVHSAAPINFRQLLSSSSRMTLDQLEQSLSPYGGMGREEQRKPFIGSAGHVSPDTFLQFVESLSSEKLNYLLRESPVRYHFCCCLRTALRDLPSLEHVLRRISPEKWGHLIQSVDVTARVEHTICSGVVSGQQASVEDRLNRVVDLVNVVSNRDDPGNIITKSLWCASKVEMLLNVSCELNADQRWEEQRKIFSEIADALGDIDDHEQRLVLVEYFLKNTPKSSVGFDYYNKTPLNVLLKLIATYVPQSRKAEFFTQLFDGSSRCTSNLHRVNGVLLELLNSPDALPGSTRDGAACVVSFLSSCLDRIPDYLARSCLEEVVNFLRTVSVVTAHVENDACFKAILNKLNEGSKLSERLSEDNMCALKVYHSLAKDSHKELFAEAFGKPPCSGDEGQHESVMESKMNYKIQRISCGFYSSRSSYKGNFFANIVKGLHMHRHRPGQIEQVNQALLSENCLRRKVTILKGVCEDIKGEDNFFGSSLARQLQEVIDEFEPLVSPVAATPTYGYR